MQVVVGFEDRTKTASMRTQDPGMPGCRGRRSQRRARPVIASGSQGVYVPLPHLVRTGPMVRAVFHALKFPLSRFFQYVLANSIGHVAREAAQ